MDKKTITNENLMKKLQAHFPNAALAPVQRGKGFYLTSIKAQYVISRLNEVFGPCGIGWKFTSSFENFNSNYIICFLELSIKVNGEWSETIAGVGGHKVAGELADAYKSARTDALTKAASTLGIGDYVFKGMVNPLDLIKRDAKSKSNSALKSKAKSKKTGITSVGTKTKKTVENITKKKVDTDTGEIKDSEEVIFEAKRKLWKLIKSKGGTPESAKNFLLNNYDLNSIEEITLDMLNDAINALQQPSTET